MNNKIGIRKLTINDVNEYKAIRLELLMNEPASFGSSFEEEDDFVAYIEANMRVQPEIYNQIRKVNAGILAPCETEQSVMDLGKNECAASANNA